MYFAKSINLTVLAKQKVSLNNEVVIEYKQVSWIVQYAWAHKEMGIKESSLECCGVVGVRWQWIQIGLKF